MSLFTGSCVAIVTPFSKDGSVNYESLKSHINFLIKNKTDSIVVCGTTGESSTLSDKEKINIVKFTVNTVNNRVPVLAGAGSNNTDKTIKLCIDLEKTGIQGLLIVTPYYNKTTQKGLVQHYKLIANSVNLPIILYNVPGRTGLNLLPSTAYDLSKLPNIVGIKEASGDISQVAEIASLCGSNLDIYAGNDDQILPTLALGGKGVISAVANIIPKDTHDIVELFMKGDMESSRNLQFNMLNLIKAIFCEVNPIPVKEALNLMGMECGGFRAPLCEMDKNNKDYLINEMKKYGLI